MNKYEKEILDDLTKVLEKIIEIERKTQQSIFSDDVFVHLSYAMEHVAGLQGITNEEIEKHRPEYLINKNN
jgi:protein-arginine kinase